MKCCSFWFILKSLNGYLFIYRIGSYQGMFSMKLKTEEKEKNTIPTRLAGT